jgi:hypothetical protein
MARVCIRVLGKGEGERDDKSFIDFLKVGEPELSPNGGRSIQQQGGVCRSPMFVGSKFCKLRNVHE